MEECQTHYAKWKKEEWLLGVRGEQKGLTAKVHEETFWINGNVLYLDCDGMYTTVHVCQNSSNYN